MNTGGNNIFSLNNEPLNTGGSKRKSTVKIGIEANKQRLRQSANINQNLEGRLNSFASDLSISNREIRRSKTMSKVKSKIVRLGILSGTTYNKNENEKRRDSFISRIILKRQRTSRTEQPKRSRPLEQNDDFLNRGKMEKLKMAQALMAMEVIKFDSIVRG